MTNFIRPSSDMLKIRTWEMPNRKIFSSWFNTHFKKIQNKKGNCRC